jgi:hypothetical protein
MIGTVKQAPESEHDAGWIDRRDVVHELKLAKRPLQARARGSAGRAGFS